MLVVWIILILLLSFLIWTLMAPISLNMDSSSNKYLINWGGLVSLALIPKKENWFLNLKIGFWKKKIFISDLLEKKMKSVKKEQKPQNKKKGQSTDFFNSFRKAKQILKSFKVRACKIDFDTDDYYWNALLIPAFQLINKGNQHRVAVNFKGKNSILIIIENRLIKILYSIIFKK